MALNVFLGDDLDLPMSEDIAPDYQVTQQVEQPPSPVLHPQAAKAKPVQATPRVAPLEMGPVTMPSQTTTTQPLPWWVWLLALLALSKKGNR